MSVKVPFMELFQLFSITVANLPGLSLALIAEKLPVPCIEEV